MSYADKIIQSMNFDIEYDSATVSAVTHLPVEAVEPVLHQLAKGGVVECVSHDRFRKNHKYKSRQRPLFNQ